MGKDVIIALDFQNENQALGFLQPFIGLKPYVKVGMELFYCGTGMKLVDYLKKCGYKVFLDLKLHDIPNTVERSMANLAKLNVDMINVHAGGTIKMMQAALRGLNTVENRPLLIAVTQLTSTSEDSMQKDLLINKSLNETVIHYAQNAKLAGLDGVVCSPRESTIIHENCGENFITVTPGIRLLGASADDQVRITTPQDAKKLGSDYIVVGRPITQAKDPISVYKQIKADFLD